MSWRHRPLGPTGAATSSRGQLQPDTAKSGGFASYGLRCTRQGLGGDRIYLSPLIQPMPDNFSPTKARR